MKKLLLVLLFIGPSIFSQQLQQERIFFSDALFEHLSDYNKKADLAYRFNDYEKAEELFQTFTNSQLEGSYMDNFKFRNLSKKEIQLYDYKKPALLITYASWCVPGKGEIPALNELATQYKNKIDFVILFWDKREKAKELSRKFSSEISIVYVDETENHGAYVVKQLKHSLGLPTCFLISADKRIIDIRRSVFHPYNITKEESFQLNYEAINSAITDNLLENSTKQDPIALSTVSTNQLQ